MKQETEPKEENLPNFLVIGAHKSGTSWLYKILKTNSEVYLYPYVKELHFFTEHYEKGLNWYKKFFPSQKSAIKYKAIGDITPTYILFEYVPERVLKIIPNSKFIIILRNPVTRAFSHYKYNKLNEGFNYNFKEYLKINKRCFRFGLYSQQIRNWLKRFPRERFLILIFEEVFKEPIKALKTISEFLNIEFTKFDTRILNVKTNPSELPRLHKIFILGFKFRSILLSKGLFRIDDILFKFKRFYSILLLGKNKEKVFMNPEVKNQLFLRYKKDIEELEKILNKNLSIWKD
ncbi:MAG: sulfotransferase domain-containing protein [Candidatus Hodarchaeota archaeon]